MHPYYLPRAACTELSWSEFLLVSPAPKWWSCVCHPGLKRWYLDGYWNRDPTIRGISSSLLFLPCWDDLFHSHSVLSFWSLRHSSASGACSLPSFHGELHWGLQYLSGMQKHRDAAEMQMETFFKNDFQNNLLSDRCAAFLLSQRQLEKEASGRQIISTPRHDKVCRNCFDHSPYDEAETTYQTKSLLSAVARRHGNAGKPSRSKSHLQWPQICILLCTQRIRPGPNVWPLPYNIEDKNRKKKYFNYFLHLLYVNKKWDPTITGTAHHRNGFFLCKRHMSLHQPQFGLIRSSSVCANWASKNTQVTAAYTQGSLALLCSKLAGTFSFSQKTRQDWQGISTISIELIQQLAQADKHLLAECESWKKLQI